MDAVREENPRDAEAVIAVVRRSITELCAQDHRNDADTLAEWLANKTPESFRAWLANDDNFCVVAESNSVIVGVGLGLMLPDLPPATFAFILFVRQWSASIVLVASDVVLRWNV